MAKIHKTHIAHQNINENSSQLLELFDQNGYDLTELEKLYSLFYLITLCLCVARSYRNALHL